jgi:hypothetical protein
MFKTFVYLYTLKKIMTVLLTLTTAGIDSGPFDLIQVQMRIQFLLKQIFLKLYLLYTSSLVPDFATTIRVVSLGNCLNSTDIVLSTTTLQHLQPQQLLPLHLFQDLIIHAPYYN